MDMDVIYLDLDYKFDIFRLSNLLQHRIEGSLRVYRYEYLRYNYVHGLQIGIEDMHFLVQERSI